MIGQVVPSLAVNTPDGYIECIGQTINKTDYPKFFEEMHIAADRYTLPDLNRNYTTIGHAGHSSFSFRAHEDGENGEYAYGSAQKHNHETVTIKRYKSKNAHGTPVAIDEVTDTDQTEGPGYYDIGEPWSPEAEASYVGDIYGSDTCILVKYLIGVE